ncbi:MAG: hypothetical protein K8S99_02195 [Planctomycetes bacterium]|nr:hypothetical protein [Planctomycetota bacterium]
MTPHDLIFTHWEWEGPFDRASRAATGELFSVRDDGAALTQFTKLNAPSSTHAYTSDGDWVFLQSNLSGDYDIYRCKSDGSALENLTRNPGGDDYGFCLSPDQRHIVYCSIRKGGTAGVKMMTVDGRDHRTLMDSHYSYMPRFAPDGKTVICVSLRPNYGVHRIDLATGKDVCLIREQGVDYHNPYPSPDGRYISCYRRPNGVGGVSEVFRIDADGGNPVALTNGNMHETCKVGEARAGSDPPHWSPDSKRLAFVTGEDEQLHVMSFDGTNVRKLTALPGACAYPRWSSDGERIAFVAETGKGIQLFVVPAEGGEAMQLTRLAGAVFWPVWCG